MLDSINDSTASRFLLNIKYPNQNQPINIIWNFSLTYNFKWCLKGILWNFINIQEHHGQLILDGPSNIDLRAHLTFCQVIHQALFEWYVHPNVFVQFGYSCLDIHLGFKVTFTYHAKILIFRNCFRSSNNHWYWHALFDAPLSENLEVMQHLQSNFATAQRHIP